MTTEALTAKTRCRACQAEVEPDAARCGHCGAAQRPQICPHCGATAGISEHKELRFRCDVCGAPRIPLLDPRFKSSGREVALLQKAQAARSARAAWRAAGVATGVLFGFTTLVALLLMLLLGFSFSLVTVFLLLGLPLGVFTGLAMQRAAARSREIPAALDAAWLAAASDIAHQAQGSLTSDDLAKAFGVDETQAEELLALLEVNDVVSGARLRIDAPKPTTAALMATPEEAAEQELLALQEAEEALQQQAALPHGESTKR